MQSARGQKEIEIMLNVYELVLGLLRKMVPVVAKMEKRDPDLARQCRRAMTSAALNIEEGRARRGGNGRLRFETAMGSANETRACIEVAVALGYLPPEPELTDGWDRAARTLRKLMR